MQLKMKTCLAGSKPPTNCIENTSSVITSILCQYFGIFVMIACLDIVIYMLILITKRSILQCLTSTFFSCRNGAEPGQDVLDLVNDIQVMYLF